MLARTTRDIEGTIMNAPVAMRKSVSEETLPASDAVARLWAALDARVKLDTPVPARTDRLVMAGEPKMAQKIVEEAGEVAVAAMMKDRAEVVRESADLIYDHSDDLEPASNKRAASSLVRGPPPPARPGTSR